MVTKWEIKSIDSRRDSRNHLGLLKNVKKSRKEGSVFLKQYLKILETENSNRKFKIIKYGALFDGGELAITDYDVAKISHPGYILFTFDNDKNPLECILLDEQHPRYCSVKEFKIINHSFKGRTINDLLYFYREIDNADYIIGWLKKIKKSREEKLDLLILHTDGNNIKRYCILDDNFLLMIYKRHNISSYHFAGDKDLRGKRCINFSRNEVEWKNYS